jgi:hypothetical protein
MVSLVVGSMSGPLAPAEFRFTSNASAALPPAETTAGVPEREPERRRFRLVILLLSCIAAARRSPVAHAGRGSSSQAPALNSIFGTSSYSSPARDMPSSMRLTRADRADAGAPIAAGNRLRRSKGFLAFLSASV